MAAFQVPGFFELNLDTLEDLLLLPGLRFEVSRKHVEVRYLDLKRIQSA